MEKRQHYLVVAQHQAEAAGEAIAKAVASTSTSPPMTGGIR